MNEKLQHRHTKLKFLISELKHLIFDLNQLSQKP